MKKLNVLTRMLLLVALLVGSVSAWGATSTLIFTAACVGSGTADDGAVWTVTSDASESNFDNSRGIHYGTGNAAVSYLNLSTSDISGTITQIAVNASGASGTTAVLNVTVGGSAFGTEKSLTSSAANYTFSGPASGEIVVSLTQESAKKALYVNSITVTYTPIQHTAKFSVNGATTSQNFYEGNAIVFPSDPASIGGKAFAGWVTEAIDGTTDTEPTFVTSPKMGKSDVTFYAVFANESVIIEKGTQKSYGFETASDADWTIDGPVRVKSDANTGSYSGMITTNNTYITFNSKVNVTSFSFALKRASNNSNYNVYIETSEDGSDWEAAATYAMSDFGNGSYTTKTKTFDGTTAYYVRFHCYNTTATRYVDDVTIVYDNTVVNHSNYCTTIPANVPVTITAAKYATFASGYDLNFSSMEEEGLYAYTATQDGKNFTFTHVTGSVKAGEGLLLYSKTAKTYNVPVATNSPVAVDGNKLVRGTGAKVSSDGEGGANNYILSNNDGEVNFYLANNKVVPTTKAYLKDITIPSGAKFFLPTGEDSETTGIRSIENGETRIENSDYYNLAGQRVGKDYKGIVIVNGKKMLNK